MVLLLAACDASFEPIAETDAHFSIMGYLNAAADTQWIRIMPLRRVVASPSNEPLQVTASILRTGEAGAVVLKDSAFIHPSALLEGGDTTYLHTFWTTQKIVPGAAYQLSVVQPDGTTSTASISIPNDYVVTTEYLSAPELTNTNVAWVEVDTEKLALVSWRWRSDCPQYPYFYDHPFEVPPPVGNVYRAQVTFQVQVPTYPGTPIPCVVPPKQLFVVTSDVVWPSGSSMASWAFSTMNDYSNLIRAEGFFGGVFSKVIPWEPCFLAPPIANCRLPYTSESATFIGTLRDPCPDDRGVYVGPPPGVPPVIRLTELPDSPTPAVRVRLRRGTTFDLQAIQPGVRYLLELSSPIRTLNNPSDLVYGTLSDTVSLQPRETLRKTYTLPRLISCDR